MNKGKQIVNDASARGQGLGVLGYVVWWGLNGVNVDGAQALADWRTAGLREKDAPKAMKPATAYAAAVQRATVGIDVEHPVHADQYTDNERFVAHKLVDVVPVIDPATQKQTDVTYRERAKVGFLKAKGDIRVSDAADPICANVIKTFRATANRVGCNQARPSVTGAIRAMGGVPLRANGGVYYVPGASQETLDALSSVVEGWGSSEFYPAPMHDTAQARRSVGDAARANFGQEMERMRGELAEWRRRQDDDDSPTTRASTLRSRLDALRDMERRAGLYTDALEIKRSTLIEGIDDLKQGIHDLIGGAI